jgi:hypothetical protein
LDSLHRLAVQLVNFAAETKTQRDNLTTEREALLGYVRREHPAELAYVEAMLARLGLNPPAIFTS